MKKHILLFLLICITAIAFCLRIYRISDNPPALSWDEVSIGYNAYSILKTGYDEHQRFLPLDTFVGYGDYKPPLAIYLTVPSIALFGLNEFGVRFPSVLFGTLTVLVTYFLVRIAFRVLGKGESGDGIGILASFLLALSPWHINLSRAGFEANIALFFVVLGIYMLIRSLELNRLQIIAWIPFVLAMYTFNSSRYFVVLFGLVFLLLERKIIFKIWRSWFVGLGIAGFLLLPLLPHLVSKEARLRFVEVNIFSDASVVERANSRMAYENNSPIAKVIYNRRIGYMLSYIKHYLDHFDPKFLFIKGDGNPKFSTQDVGELYMVEAPFFIIGFFLLSIRQPNLFSFLLIWLLLAIVPAATARETPHALRILNTLPTWQIFITYGVWRSLIWIKSQLWKKIYIVILALVYIGSCTYYLYNYFVHYPKEFSSEWQYGYKQALASFDPSSKDTIYITDKIGRPYMYTLFYTVYDPREFWKTKKSYFDAAGFYHVDGFGKYQFVSTAPNSISGNSIVIGNPGWAPENTQSQTIQLLNGEPALSIYSL